MEEIKNTISKLIQDVLDGNEDSLKTYIELKELEKHLKSGFEAIEKDVIIEAQKYEGKTFNKMGYEITFNEGKRSYVFKHIEKWNDLSVKLKEIEEMAKQSALNQSKKILNVSESDGEIIEPCVIKYSKPFITIKKK